MQIPISREMILDESFVDFWSNPWINKDILNTRSGYPTSFDTDEVELISTKMFYEIFNFFVELFKIIPSKKCFYQRYQPYHYYCIVGKSLTSLVTNPT